MEASERQTEDDADHQQHVQCTHLETTHVDNYHTNTHTRLTALFPGLPGWASTRKVKPIWILLKQETVSGSGISRAICKSAPRSRQITTPEPHHSVFYRPDALPATQPTASKHWRRLLETTHVDNYHTHTQTDRTETWQCGGVGTADWDHQHHVQYTLPDNHQIGLHTLIIRCSTTKAHTHTDTHPFNGSFLGLPRWAGTRKVKPIWILLKQETVSGSGISWVICKSAPCSRQITMPAPHCSVFHRPDALPAFQPQGHYRQ